MPSSVISAVKYDPVSCTLRVIFVSGQVYDYQEVPPEVYKAMISARSKGTYLNNYIKGNYEFRKIIKR